MVGRDLLGESGYQEFSMRAVAARCGIGVGTLYNYYSSKQQLVAAILRSEWEVHLRRMAQIARSDRPELDRLTDVFGEVCAFMRGRHSLLISELPQSMGSDEIRSALAQRSAVRQQVADMLGAILHQRPEEQRQWLADCIARLFLSYSSYPEYDAAALHWILVKLLS